MNAIEYFDKCRKMCESFEWFCERDGEVCPLIKIGCTFNPEDNEDSDLDETRVELVERWWQTHED